MTTSAHTACTGLGRLAAALAALALALTASPYLATAAQADTHRSAGAECCGP